VPPEVAVLVRGPEGLVVLGVSGALDAATGEALVSAVLDAVAGGAGRLDVDLSNVTSYTDEGASSLLACHEATDALPDGLHYRTSGTAGRQALVTAFADSEPYE
jgi:hypothetical protein